MRKALRMRYYCEFCNKGSGSASYMKRHEAGCTNNDRASGEERPPLPEAAGIVEMVGG